MFTTTIKSPLLGALKAALLCLAVFFLASSCALDKVALNMIADTLSKDGDTSVFTGDDDYELVGDALPFAIKMYETILASNPNHQGLKRMVGSLYVMYANAFVQGPSEYLPDDQFDERLHQEKRAIKFYLRGRNMLAEGLDLKYPGFYEEVVNGEPQEYLQAMKSEDTSSLYWIAAAWFGAFSLDNMNVQLSLKIGNALACLDKAYELDPNYGNGSLEELYVQILASLPPELGGSLVKAEEHYQKAFELSGGKSASLYMAWASTVLMNQQDVEGFTEYMHKILDLNLDDAPEIRLQNAMAQKKAQWYLDHLDEFFLM